MEAGVLGGIDAFKENDYELSRGVAGGRRLSANDAASIALNISTYGAHLASLSEETWTSSACQWMRGYWDALVDLNTVEEGVSDLVLSMRIFEAPEGYEFQVLSVHVP